MLNQASLRDPVLVNTLGHSAGLLLFGLILVLLVRNRRTVGAGGTRLSVAAAMLALGWNAGSLIALGAAAPDSFFLLIVMTASFAVLSLLPAVLLHVVLGSGFGRIVAVGYVISALAAALHTAELFTNGSAPHQMALLLIAGGFAVLTVSAIALKYGLRGKGRFEWLSLACLLLFAVSFPHFGYQHPHSPWTVEIAWHHIGIPVALIVLLQDYRFLLLDTFIRFLMNSLLAAAYVGLIFLCAERLHLGKGSNSSFVTGVALVSVCLSLVLFAHLRRWLQEWTRNALFHRKNLEGLVCNLQNLSAATRSEEQLILEAAAQIAAYLGTGRYTVTGEVEGDIDLSGPRITPESVSPLTAWAEVQVPLRFSSGEVRTILLGPRRGHQRYLSEDMKDLRRVASVMVEQVERFRSEELRRLAAQAELRALQAQINPHFLFNAFNTLYGSIDRGAVDARRMVLNLTEIFRFFLQSERLVIRLSEELRIVRAYLEIEGLRLGDRLEALVEIEDEALAVMLPVLCLQPLVENAVKHGIASKVGKGRVQLRAFVMDGFLRITVEDECVGFSSGIKAVSDGLGLGLMNVRQRLRLSYGHAALLDVRHEPQGCKVTLTIPMALPLEAVS